MEPAGRAELLSTSRPSCEALLWLDERTPKEANEAVTQALCCLEVVNHLNEVWCEGNFEEFRSALREYLGAGLRAMKGAA